MLFDGSDPCLRRYMGLSLSWGDPKTFQSIHLAVSMVPLASHDSETAKDHLLRTFEQQYGLS